MYSIFESSGKPQHAFTDYDHNKHRFIDVSNMPGTHVATDRICMLENMQASHESLQLLQDVCH